MKQELDNIAEYATLEELCHLQEAIDILDYINS